MPAALATGSVYLAGGRVATGFPCEPWVVGGAEETAQQGGRRAFRRAANV